MEGIKRSAICAYTFLIRNPNSNDFRKQEDGHFLNATLSARLHEEALLLKRTLDLLGG